MRKEKESRIERTEERLYLYADLCERIRYRKEEIAGLEAMDTDALMTQSRSIASVTGSTCCGRDIVDRFDGQLRYMRACLAAEQREVRAIRRAIRTVRSDPYYPAVEQKYFKRMTDKASSSFFGCGISTLRRHRLRLVERIADALDA